MSHFLHNENCLITMKRELRDESVDMILTSPPYDNLRNYKGYEFDFEAIAPELFRVLKQGGVMVWVVNDATIDGSETGTSFKQALFFKEIGFKLNDTMIYLKTNPMPAPNRYRYFSAFEYMFVFSKGYPVTFNPLLAPRSNMTGDKRRIRHLRYGRNKDGIYPDKYVVYTVQEQVKRTNVWEYSVGMNNTTTDKIAYSHPAIFPEALAEDHILSWSNEGDVIYDPFSGSGTTGKMARKHGRNFIGSEISKEYCEIAWKRICNVQGVLL